MIGQAPHQPGSEGPTGLLSTGIGPQIVSSSNRFLKLCAFWSACWGALTLGIGSFFRALPTLPDTDSYYHLFVARLYGQEGIVDHFPWARFSLLNEAFSDKELLFHLLLAPFTFGPAPHLTARWVLGGLVALLVCAFSAYGKSLWGRAGLLVGPICLLLSFDTADRMIRLRPELLSCLLIVAAISAASRQHWRLLGLITALFTLAYTAFHALVGLILLWAITDHLRGRRVHWQQVLYPLLGAGLALCLHPHFPNNLLWWKVVAIDVFVGRAEGLDVGSEIFPTNTWKWLQSNGLWIAAVTVLYFSATKKDLKPGVEPVRERDYLAISAGVFGLLYAMARRFSIYFVPLTILSIGAHLAIRQRRPDLRLKLAGVFPCWAALAIIFMLGIGRSVRVGSALISTPALPTTEEDWARFGAAVPQNAKIAAHWGMAQALLYFAPQGLYLNFLDPILMVLPYPEVYKARKALFENRSPDLAYTLAHDLDSDHIAVSGFSNAGLLKNLATDPRFMPVFVDFHSLYRLVPNSNSDFLLDWRLIEPHSMPPSETDFDSGRKYPRHIDPLLRGIEGFVDLRKFNQKEPCIRVATVADPPSSRARLRLDAASDLQLWVGGVATSISAGSHTFTAWAPRAPRQVVGIFSCRVPNTAWGFSARWQLPGQRQTETPID